jgi:hypothetical protein
MKLSQGFSGGMYNHISKLREVRTEPVLSLAK